MTATTTTTKTTTTQSPQPATSTMTGAELQCMREACAVSREELADLVGVQSRTVKHWESGRATVPADVAAIMASIDTEAQAVADFIVRQAANRPSPYRLEIQRRHTASTPGADSTHQQAMHTAQRSVYASRTPAAQHRAAVHLALIGGQVRGAMLLRMQGTPAIIEWATE